MNYYEILGVGDKADADEIKRAYRRLASQHHPDKGGDKNKFQEIEQAYRTLSDNNKRQEYDMQRNGFGGPGGVQFHWHTGSHGHPDIDAIFRQFGFGGGGDPFGGFRQPQRRNKDLRIEIPIPLVTTLEEQKKTVSVTTTNGEKTTVEVTIPRGVTNGTNIRYSGLGDNLFASLPRGDLYVQINVHNAENFIVNNIDLYTQVSVNCLLAITGGSVFVSGLDNRTFELTIPPGTQPNTRFRIHGQGLYQMNTQVRGHLYADVAIEIPKDLTEEQLEIVRSLLNPQ
jgi:DnaJ-class molecular chaperone